MSDFNFITAKTWLDLPYPAITFLGSSSHYKDLGSVQYIMYDGSHVATKFGQIIKYNPKATGRLPKGFQAACKLIPIPARANYRVKRIMELLSVDQPTADKIEDIMRHDIFHSTLDWQTQQQLDTAAMEAHEIFKYIYNEQTKTNPRRV